MQEAIKVLAASASWQRCRRNWTGRTENEDLRRLSERDKMILKLEHDNAAAKEATQRRFEAEAMQARMEQLLKQVHELQIVVAACQGRRAAAH
ncbi:MAG: hypothetical protein U0793_18450 [Gemmataceae bacterium]